MFYDTHFTMNVTNWSRGVWLDGTTQITNQDDILLSDRILALPLRMLSGGGR
jgi:hypothetical protein